MRLDDILAYQTVKVVTIRDARMGILYYSLMILLLAYIIGYLLIHKKDYALMQTPTGTITPTLINPQKDHERDATQLPYCNASFKHPHMKKKPCQFWDSLLVRYPEAEHAALFVTTHVVNTTQKRPANCNLGDFNCRYKNLSSSDFFLGNIEEYVVDIYYSVRANHVGLSADSGDIPGSLMGPDGMIPAHKGESIGAQGQVDRMYVKTILKAAGIKSLDHPSPFNSSETVRESGLILLVELEFSNEQRWGLGHPYYTYNVRAVESEPIVQLLHSTDLASRVIWERKGLRILFSIGGQFGKFDLPAFTHFLSTSAAILGTAAVVVDLISSHVLPRFNRVYLRFRRARIEVTPTPTEVNEEIYRSHRARDITNEPLLETERTGASSSLH
jgi:hypothetical protein